MTVITGYNRGIKVERLWGDESMTQSFVDYSKGDAQSAFLGNKTSWICLQTVFSIDSDVKIGERAVYTAAGRVEEREEDLALGVDVEAVGTVDREIEIAVRYIDTTTDNDWIRRWDVQFWPILENQVAWRVNEVRAEEKKRRKEAEGGF